MNCDLAVIGSFVQDLAFKVDQFPLPGETRIGFFASGPGGKGSNQAVAAHRQGVAAVFIGAVGDDLFGDGYKSWAEVEKLPIDLLTVPEAATGAASIVVNARAENQIVVALGANDNLTPEHVRRALKSCSGLKVILLQAESNLSAAAAALSFAGENGIFTIFNPAPINPDVSPELIVSADLITPNETEFCFLVRKFSGYDCREDLSAITDGAMKELCSHLPAAAVLITLGAAGSIFYQQQEPHRLIARSGTGVIKGAVMRFPAAEVTPIDTTGAGDAFNGGLAAALVKFSGDLRRAISYATIVAGISTERPGTAPAMPKCLEVESRFTYQE